MQIPNISNVVKDEGRQITCDFLACRKLGERELLQHYSVFLRTLKKKPKKGSTFKIMTTIGAHDPI